MEERRQHIRYCTDFSAKYFYIKRKTRCEGDTTVKDLSIKGMRLYLPPMIAKDDIFLVEMKSPALGTIAAIAKVIWTKDIQAERESGARFDWVSNSNRLAKYIEDLKVKAA